MRSAGNFSPEWGYLAPAPSFARIARMVLVATAIGATAGAGVVLSLLDRPSEPEKSPVAARAIVTSVRAAAVPSVAPAAPAVTAAPPRCRTHPQPRTRHLHCRSRRLTRIPLLRHLLRRVPQLQRRLHCQRRESRRTSSKLHRRMRPTAPQSWHRSRLRRRKRQSTTRPTKTLNFPE